MKGVLKVLMWKHLIVRMRRFIHTPVEIIAPILLFILYYSLKDQLASLPPDNTYSDSIQQTESVEINSLYNPLKIYYTPETDFTNRLMKLVENYYTLHPPPNTFVANANPLIKPLQNTSMLQKPPHGVAVVIFKGLDLSDQEPPKLTYTIRINEDFKTYSYISDDVYIGPHYGFGTVYETFMKLQWAIDSGYLKILGDRDIPENVILKEFPYKKSHQDYTATLVAEMMATICSLSLLLVFVFLMARLLEERVTGIQELIKMVGVSNTMLSISHVLNCAPTCLVFAVAPAVLLTASATPVLQNTNIILIMILLALYFISIMSMAFVCSYIVNNDQYTVTIAVFSYIFLTIPTRVVLGLGVPRWLLPLCGLLPHMPMEWFWKESGALQQFGLGLNFGNMASPHTASTMSVLSCYLYLIVQSIIFFALSWYLSFVRPGPYGQPLPWNFICNKSYWSKTKVTPEESEELEELEEAEEINPKYFDQPIKDAEVGIRVVNVTKIFGKNRALHNVSLDLYKGEITVLLGHNGAGKTTLMSIITGMLKPTEGKVYVEGFDTDTQKDEMRKHLGLCPQHNLFFNDLTVLEHVIFFTMIKGIPYGKAKKSSTKLLEQLNLGSKLQECSSSLSGGMKRRLQLACALAGDARVLVLDEPTSGLDVETRRELWDLLLSLSASRTVLLSTHFMEEAEALGERVAALRGGRLRCRASTLRLKRAIGSGYRLSFTTIGLPNEPALTAAILSVIPEASLKETSLNSISYNLPAKYSDKFPKLFNLLESKRFELGINTIGVGVSTLEEVFLKLCSDITTTFTDDTVDGETQELEPEIVTGFHLYKQQFMVLLKRQLQYLWSKKISFIIMQVISPILVIIAFTLITNNSFTNVPESNGKQTLAMDLNMYEPMTDRRALYSVNSDKYNIDNVKKRNPKVAFEKTDDVAKAVLRVGTKDTMEYNKYLVGVELNDTDAKILFTTVVRHAAPVALNLLSNLLASRNGRTITTYNDPAFEYTHRETRKNEPKNISLLSLWSFMLVFIILSTLVNSASLPCKERVSGARHLHVMAGCAPALHWLAALLAHAALHALALALPALAVAAALEQDGTIDQGDFLGVLAFVMILGILAFLSLIYLVSFIFGERGAGVALVGIIVIFGFIFPLLSQMPRNDSTKILYYFLDTSSYVMPPQAFSIAVVKVAGIARENVTPDTPRRSYLAIDDNSPGLYVLLLFVQFVVLMTLVILTECGVFNSCCDRFFNVRYAPSTPANVDIMVAAEKLYVDKASSLPPKQIQNAMLANDLHKNYPSLFRQSCNAVKGVSFSVKSGECFGLLGVNGAGKSTTFKMLTAVECPTRGSIFSNGYFMKMLSGEYLRSLGYCPQTQALDDFLSGRDNIVLLLTLRGVAPGRLKQQADRWISTVGLERYATRALSTYSGGCARRLSAAAALCAGACTLLDEPTAGVDVAARRRLWAAVRRAAACRALVVCSHSMDEMEALCGRIAIMSRGRVRALGEAAELRAAHGAGHALTLKLYHRPAHGFAADVDVPDNAMADLNNLKATLREKFNCTLRDEHSTTLHYHINDTMTYSDLFAALERLKEKFPNLLEDYSVTETTLEEVFLSFAREEVNEGPTPV